ncbi:hypothetical protein, partial [Burkholderia cenocepacia]|uniref:hypothetical protein n=1 Tax=Burkholderia cenocepacia TaxID=95486 RepID=UPI002DD69203
FGRLVACLRLSDLDVGKWHGEKGGIVSGRDIPFFLGWTRFPANVSEQWKGVKRPASKGGGEIPDPTRTGATEVIRHIVMWKLH